MLVGAGVVGRAILRAHVEANIPCQIADLDAASVQQSIAELALERSGWRVTELQPIGGKLATIAIVPPEHTQAGHAQTDHTATPPRQPDLLIESISERLELKRTFFAEAESWWGDDTVLCSNTSTLRIGRIAETLARPSRFCGMHFFMPIHERPAVELIASASTSSVTTQRCVDHAKRLGKQPLVVSDGPGFVVNRMLAPYLNQAMHLVCSGASPARIEQAAQSFGMPMSPLELIDWIGMRTTFDAGRCFWQAYPARMDPAPVLAGMIKQNRRGRPDGGFYDYDQGERSELLSPTAAELCEKYSRQSRPYSNVEIEHLLAIPMWIESACLLRERVVSSLEAVEMAMSGGLGYTRAGHWYDYFDRLGCQQIIQEIESAADSRAMVAPEPLMQSLRHSASPRDAILDFASLPSHQTHSES